MAITRRSLAETYEHQDAIIEAAQTAKREATQAYRQQLDEMGMDKDNIKAEVEAFKIAYRRKVAVGKKGSDEVEHRDAIADEIFLEITASRAPRATRVENIEEFPAETGETEPAATSSDGAGAASGPLPNLNAAPATNQPGTAVTRAEPARASAGEAVLADLPTHLEPLEHSAVTLPEQMQTDIAVNLPAVEAANSLAGAECIADRQPHSVVLSREQGILRLRPNCQEPSACKSSGGRNHCYACKKAAEAKAGAA